MLSLMTYHDPHALVRGLDSFPQRDWPSPLSPVHLAFQVMVGAGFAMLSVVLWAVWLLWRRHTIYDTAWFLRALVAASPLGIIAVEAGWVVTELGRQPWIIYGVMRTADAVTPMPGLAVSFALFTILYFFLAVTVAYLLWERVIESPKLEEATAFAAAVGR